MQPEATATCALPFVPREHMREAVLTVSAIRLSNAIINEGRQTVTSKEPVSRQLLANDPSNQWTGVHTNAKCASERGA